MDQEFRPKHKGDGVYSQKLKAGKRRTYFFDIRATRSNDYYLTITESKKKLNEDGYERHKVFLYKEDFNKFIAALTETIDHVKTELMPEYDFDEFARNQEARRKAWEEERNENPVASPAPSPRESSQQFVDESSATKPSEPKLEDGLDAKRAETNPISEESIADAAPTEANSEEDLSW